MTTGVDSNGYRALVNQDWDAHHLELTRTLRRLQQRVEGLRHHLSALEQWQHDTRRRDRVGARRTWANGALCNALAFRGVLDSAATLALTERLSACGSWEQVTEVLTGPRQRRVARAVYLALFTDGSRRPLKRARRHGAVDGGAQARATDGLPPGAAAVAPASLDHH